MKHARSRALTRRSTLIGAFATAGVLGAFGGAGVAKAADASQLLRMAFDNWRSKSSRTVVKMTIHRPTWERKMTMVGYSRGDDDALVRFISPPKATRR